MKKTRHRKHAKIALRLADLEHAKSAVLNSLASPESRRSYEFAIQNFVEWYCSEPRLAPEPDRRDAIPHAIGATSPGSIDD
jgi:hypothetical protein